MSCFRTALLCSILLLPTVALGQETFTPWHVAKLRVVTAAVISPDGTQIAYTLSVPRQIPKEEDGPSWSELHVVDTKGNSTPFITGKVRIGDISWTPDGKSIAYLAKRDKDTTRSLYTIGGRGGESKRIVTHPTDIMGYSFSGDGKRVAFLATEPVSAAKKKRQEQGFTQEIYEEDQPPVRVWIATLEGDEPARMLKLDGSASELHWNPKEDKIAVALAPNALIDEQMMFRKVHIVDLHTASGGRKPPGVTNLNNPGKMGHVAWSPDGKKLAIVTGRDKHDPREGRLWASDLNQPKWSVYNDDRQHVEAFAWISLDRLAFIASYGVYSLTGSTSPKGPSRAVTGHDGAWTTPASMSASANGNKVALVRHTELHPPEVYIIEEFDDHAVPPPARRLTDSNPWLKDMKFAKQEVIKYKARDGLELEGILIHPLGHTLSGKPRCPLVLNVHGGPESHYSNGFLTNYNMLGQVAAAKGMAVFYPNYRGSTGYGVEFSMKGQAAAGGKEFDDLVDGVDHLVKMGLVDPKKVGITGGSYGGYATAWGATYYSDRFAAGVMFVGVSDWISCSGTTDIPYEMNLVHHRKWLWEDWDYFTKSSPIHHLEKAKTPLLIMHGKSDPRVHPSQSLELYRHLKVRGKAPVRLVLYPGEGHGNARAASRLDYNLRLLQWMEHYLKGPGGAPPPYELDYGPQASEKTGGNSWNRPPTRVRSELVSDRQSEPWLGRGCPCCVGW